MLPSPVTGRPDQRTLALDERLAGAVERVTFHSDETGFCVLQVRARGYRRVVTLVGHVPSVAAGEFVEAEGGWVHHRAHGAQFQADTLAVTAPATVDDLGGSWPPASSGGSDPPSRNASSRPSGRGCST